jgi:tetratricopeptide (TPR) repeat protein
MTRTRAPLGGALLLIGLLAQAGPSRADKAAAPSTPAAVDPNAAPANMAPKLELDGPEAEAKDRARVLFLQGVAAYRAGKYYEAVEIFLETQRIYPDTQLCFNVARAYENLGNVRAALRYYRDYLRQADRPSDGDDVRERVRKLSQQLALLGVQQLSVFSQPEAATVLLDGRPVGITPWTGETYPGKHRLALALDGHASQEQVVEVEGYAARDVSVVLLPKPASVPKVLPPLLANKPKPPGVSVASLVTLGTGIALLGTAIAAEAGSKDAGMSRATAFFAGSGLGVSAVGGVMLYFDLSPRVKAATPAQSRDLALVQH